MTVRPASPVLILGARSDIARALARAYAERGCALILAARCFGDIESDCRDLALRYGVEARPAELDVTDGAPDQFFAGLGEAPGTVVLAVGLLGEQSVSAADDRTAAAVLDTNFAGPARYLLAAARAIKREQGSAIIGISSVAGDRGRGSNFIYGSAKAGLTAFLSGLRNTLAAQGVHVLTVKPGFVATRMTEHLVLPARLTASPDEVARAVVRAHERGRDVIYIRRIWRLIMLIIRLIPERLFKRLKL